jgi:2-oxoglutarate ferredoxin oxidoreductase subunit beta
VNAIKVLAETPETETLTGVLYVNPQAPTFMDVLNLVDEPLAQVPEAVLRPSRQVLEQVMEELR